MLAICAFLLRIDCHHILCPAQAPAEGIPDWWGGGTCQLRTRCWQSVCQRAHAGTDCARRTGYPCAPSLCHRKGMWMSPAFKKNLTLARLKDRAVKVDIFAHEAGGRLAGKQIFTRPALAARASFSRHPMIYYPKELFCTRMAGRHNLLFLHTPPAASLPKSTCSHRLCNKGRS